MPALFRLADRAAIEAQKRLLMSTRLQLILVIVAAAGGAIDNAGAIIVGVVAFSVALVIQVHRSQTKPAEQWRDGRVAAESAKSLAWSYMVRGEPFGHDLPAAAADELFVDRIMSITATLPRLVLAKAEGTTEQITDAMRELRSTPLPERRDAYSVGRIEDQTDWYLAKSAFNARRAARWQTTLLVAEVLGITGGIARLTGAIEFDLLGIAAAAVAAGAAWLQTKRHDELAASYLIAANDLAAVGALLQHQETEGEWGAFVAEAEKAISREHSLWSVSHTS